MSWHQVSTNHYQRPLGENERLIKFIGDRAHPAGREKWSVSATATFKPCDNGPISEWSGILHDAWKLLRFHHPSIASTPVAASDSLEYEVPSENDLESWIEHSFFIIEDKSAEDVVAEVKPSPPMILYFFPHRWEILLHTSHWRTDGYGAFQLLNAFFDSVKMVIDNDGLPSLYWGEEATRLVPSVETALNLPEHVTPETTVSAIKYATTQAYLKDSVGISYNGDTTTRPGGTRCVKMMLSKERTEALERAAKKRAIDIYAAIHAALAIVNFQFASPAPSSTPISERQYASTIRLSLRPHLVSPYTNNPSVAAGVYTGGYVFKVNARDSFDDIARSYQHEYETGVNTEFIQSRRQFAAMAIQGLQRGMPPPNPPPSNIDISFVTEADDLVNSIFTTKHGPLEISRIGLGVETLTRQPYLFFWKFRGRLDFSLVYNEAYQDAKMASKILNSLIDKLETEFSS